MKNIAIIILACICLGLDARDFLHKTPNAGSSPSLRPRAGNCIKGTQKIFLDINNVRAQLLNRGDMWWDGSSVASYEVPKRTQQQIDQNIQPFTALFAGSIWISGENSGNLFMAAMTFGAGGTQQFFPGPLKTREAKIQKDICNKFDKFWKVNKVDIDKMIAGEGISSSILEWPGRKNPALIASGKFTSADLNEPLAPFYDKIPDGIYNPGDGEYPAIKYTTVEPALADEMIFWVMNDEGNVHSDPDAANMGIQLNCLAFAFQASDEINDMTFYTYQITNKASIDYEKTYMSQFCDVDLGGSSDDYVGCDTSADLGYAYNADPFDAPQNGSAGYGAQVPMIGLDFFEGPKSQTGQPIGLTSFIYFLNVAGGPNSDPNTASEFRNNQLGLTKAGLPFTYGGNCTGGSIPTKYCFIHNPKNPKPDWSMCSEGLPQQDIRFVQNSGPFDLNSGDPQVISIGAVFVRPPVGTQDACLADIASYLLPADEKAQALFDAGFRQTEGPEAPSAIVHEEYNKISFTLYNDKASNNFGNKYNKKDKFIPVTVKTIDSTYRFEGYQIFQVLDGAATNNDLSDPNKAKLVRQMDILNEIDSQIVNFTVKNIGGSVFKDIDYAIELANKGIENSFTIENDLFSQEGNSNLVNNKPYYFAIRSFAYNNFKDGNKEQNNQIKFSNNVKVFSAIPHVTNIYGDSIKKNIGDYINVKRKTGIGHGSYFLDLLSSEVDTILTKIEKLELTYLGGRSPIKVTVIDPYKLREASFKLTLRDTSAILTNEFSRKASFWDLEIKNKGGSIELISSESNIDRTYSQSIFANLNSKIESYGISVETAQSDLAMTVPRSGAPVYKLIGASLTYEDPENQWLKFIEDKDAVNFEDWIRCGIVNDTNIKFQSAFNRIGNVRRYHDVNKEFGKILNGTIAPYCLTSNNAVTSNTLENNHASGGPGFKWKYLWENEATMRASHEFPYNNLDSIFSVDIVISKDPNKWSQCLVLETGEFYSQNEGGARKGQLRQGQSKDRQMQDISGTGEVGRSYFPGYAINLETGVRMNIYFGENSSVRGDNAGNMIFDPSSILKTTLGSPVLGGGHFVYVTNTKYDGGDADYNILKANFNKTTGVPNTNSNQLDINVANIYKSFAWAFMPIADTSMRFSTSNYKIPTDIHIKVRVQKPYQFYENGGNNQSVYTFSTEDFVPKKYENIKLRAFDDMRIVPNPYNAFSIYEQSAVQNIVKFVNVPEKGTISIYTTDGVLVRRIKLAESGIVGNYGALESNRELNTENAYSWDMRTTSGVLIASGVYYVHVEVPNVGSRVMKLFATMRSIDVSNF